MPYAQTPGGLLLPPDVYARIVNAGPNPPAGTPLLDGDVNAKRYLKNGVLLDNNAAYANVAYLDRTTQTFTGIQTLSGQPYLSYSRTAAAQTLTTGTEATVLWDTDQSSRSGTGHITYDTGTGIATIGTAGIYLIRGSISIATAAGGAQRYFFIDKNSGGATYSIMRLLPSGALPADLHSLDVLLLAVNDTIRWRAYQDSGGNLNITANTAACRMAIMKVA